MRKVAGIFTIIGGIFGIIVGGLAVMGTAFLTEVTGIGGLAGIGAGLIGLGVVALIGGIYAMKARMWGLALAGAICALFPVVPLGVLAIIFIVIRKREFACPAG